MKNRKNKNKPVPVKQAVKKKSYDITYIVGGAVVAIVGVGSYLFFKRK